MLVGRQTPNFKAKAYHQGKIIDVNLEDYRGKWVVLCFYPGDFTFVWPTELTQIAVGYDTLQSLNVEVLSVSVDSVFSHKVWDETELSKMVDGGIPYPMLSDPGGKIGELFDVYDEEEGVNIRGRFIIDPEGIIQAAEILTSPVGRNPEELLRQIKAYQHHQKTGEVIPSGWQEGGSTLTPSPELAGKVWKEWKPKK